MKPHAVLKQTLRRIPATLSCNLRDFKKLISSDGEQTLWNLLQHFGWSVDHGASQEVFLFKNTSFDATEKTLQQMLLHEN